MLRAKALQRLRFRQREHLSRHCPHSLAKLVRTANALALPERNRSRHTGRGRRHAGCGGDEHAVAGDLLDPPARSAEQERLPGTGLVDHFLVELADAATAVDQVDAEEAAVRNRARIRDSEPPRSFTSANDAALAVPHD